MFLLSRTFLNIIIFIYFHDHCVLSPYDSIDHCVYSTVLEIAWFLLVRRLTLAQTVKLSSTRRHHYHSDIANYLLIVRKYVQMTTRRRKLTQDKKNLPPCLFLYISISGV